VRALRNTTSRQPDPVLHPIMPMCGQVLRCGDNAVDGNMITRRGKFKIH
jgi:hypothetical protein